MSNSEIFSFNCKLKKIYFENRKDGKSWTTVILMIVEYRILKVYGTYCITSLTDLLLFIILRFAQLFHWFPVYIF